MISNAECLARLKAELQRCEQPREIRPGIWRMDPRACHIATEIMRRERFSEEEGK